MNKNDLEILKITDITAEGFGVGRSSDGFAVFVPGTAVGDELEAKILKVKKSYAYGKAEKILTPSKDRIAVDCPVFSRCGGCTLRHISYESEADFKYNRVYETVKRIGGVDLKPQPIVAAGNINRYRNKAQYPVAQSGKTGFYAANSHRIVACEDCLLQSEDFKTVAAAFGKWITDYGVSVYNEETKKGLVRHLYLREGTETKEIMAVIVVNGDSIPHEQDLVNRLKAACEKIKSIQLNINKKDTNVVLGERYIVIYGGGSITDYICGVKVRLSPASFYQVNHEMAQRLYEKAREYASPEGKNVLDLYCGTGTIGLTMASKAKSVIGVEVVKAAIDDANKNAKDNGFDNTRFICGDAAKAAQQLKNEGISVDAVILDPPRKGCEEALLKTVAKDFCPERIVYVSCDVSTLARDIKTLHALGYELKEYTPFDLFPRTAHCEVIALITRNFASR